MPRPTGSATPTSPQAALSSAIKTARNIMRKDAGLSGETDRIPQLAWLFFLKAFDDAERNRKVTDRDFRPAIEEPYRWRDWAADPVDGRTGQELLTFVNSELLPYLRGLTGTSEHDPRDVVASVFRDTHNRMLSGYLLRDVTNKVDEINFTSSDDIHTMAHLYESMLRELRDAAGDSGEFYTPRPAIRFLVEQIDPQPGEVVLDPACGTGGFLVEALAHIEPKINTTEQRRELERNLRGIEKKPLPYLLGMMNMSLHGIGLPNIVRDNALSRPITEIKRADRVDVVLTNPPFGGEEERGIQDNFPAGSRTAETALLFMQLVIRSLKDGGRCGMVVPNGFLFGDGFAARVKQQLLAECDLHTVVRLPSGVFAPYTDIPTNLLFFEKTGRTREVWYYEVPPPADRKKYSKTKPMRLEEFANCQIWWGGSTRDGRVENEHAWRVPISELEESGFNLDRKNPHREAYSHRSPDALAAEASFTEGELTTLLAGLLEEISATSAVIRELALDPLHLRPAAELRAALVEVAVSAVLGLTDDRFPRRRLGDVAAINPPPTRLAQETLVSFVPMAAVDDATGSIIGAEDRLVGELRSGYKQFRTGDVVFARITPCMQNGKSAVVAGGPEFALGSTEFHVLRPGPEALPEWIHRVLRTRWLRNLAAGRFTGTAGQQRVPADFLRDIEIPVPHTAAEQREALEEADRIIQISQRIRTLETDQAHRLKALENSVRDATFAPAG